MHDIRLEMSDRRTTPRFTASALKTVETEIQALESLRSVLEASPFRIALDMAIEAMAVTDGRVIVSGMGKSGHIGRKIAATLASTGTPAFFVHPAEASHGDLGMVTKEDVVLALSNSGESQELSAILPIIKRQGIVLIAMTGDAQSTLAKHALIVLDSAVEKEACPMNLAPTASTTGRPGVSSAVPSAAGDS